MLEEALCSPNHGEYRVCIGKKYIFPSLEWHNPIVLYYFFFVRSFRVWSKEGPATDNSKRSCSYIWWCGFTFFRYRLYICVKRGPKIESMQCNFRQVQFDHLPFYEEVNSHLLVGIFNWTFSLAFITFVHWFSFPRNKTLDFLATYKEVFLGRPFRPLSDFGCTLE